APRLVRAAARRALALLFCAALASACAAPSWMPLIGKPKPAAAPAPPPAVAAPVPPPAPAPLNEGAQRLPDSPEVIDRGICVVNNDAITQFELDEAEAHYLYETKQGAMSDEARRELRERLLQNIIENRIQLQQAEREKITVDDAEIQEQITEIMKRVNAPA